MLHQIHCDVIITYSWNRVGYNILRSLCAHGCKVWVADTSKINICSVSKYCAGSFVYPDPFTSRDQFIECLKRKIEELRPKVLLPTHDESQIIMAHRDEFPKDLIIPYSSAQLLKIISDKSWATELALSLKIPVPTVYHSSQQVDHFPCVFKTVIGNSAKGVFFPKNQEELQSLERSYSESKTLIQEMVDGYDYSVDCVRWGSFFGTSTYRALVTKTSGGGTSTQRVMVHCPILEKYSKILLDAVDYQGVCGLDYKYDDISGKVAFIEVNARFTGGIATPIAAGFDIPWILYSLSTTGEIPNDLQVRIGTKTKWILGDIITLVGRIATASFNRAEWKSALSFRGFDAYDDFRSDDKRAILGEMWYYLNKLIKNRRLNP